MAHKVGRNEACPCGSRRKYKHCCLRKGVNDPFSRRRPVEPVAPPPPPFRPSRLRGSYFTPAAAEAVSRGVELPDLDLHPWIVAQLRERTGIGQGGRPPAWTISRVRAMDTETLVATLARLGVHVDRVTFMAAAAEQFSAWDVSLDWEPIAGADAELLGLIACELWRRWLPELPSLEMIDERMQDGYDALERGDAPLACEIWLEVWALLLGTLPDAGSLAELDAGFVTGLNRLGNWAGDVSVALINHGGVHGELVRRARTVYLAAAEQLGDPRVRRDLAELHYVLGDLEAGGALLEALILDHPDDPTGYSALAFHLGWTRHGDYADVPRAIALLEQALARPVRDATQWGFEQRVADLRKQLGAG